MSSTEILLYLLLDLAIIIVAARALGWLATRVGQPRVIGEIFAGILLGPTLLGRIDPSWPARIFPPEVPLGSIANLGLVFFMFLVGLEIDAGLLRKVGHRAVWISHNGIAFPLVLGFLLGLGMVDVNNGGSFLPGATHPPPPAPTVFALFLGAAMCITAFPVLARMLVDSGLYKTNVGTATISAAAVDDVTAWCILAAVVGIARTGTPVEAIWTVAGATVYVAVLYYVVRRGLEVLARRYDATGRLTIDQIALLLAGVLLSAYITERIGIHAVFGAFFFGAIMPKRAGMTRELVDKIEDFTLVVLLPVFFAVSGLRTNLFAIDSVSLFGWLLLILLAAIIGKFLGCGWAARATGSSTREAATIGALMNTRGLTELVILSIGLNLGVLSDRTFAMMVVMALVTTAMAAPIVNRLMPRERVLRELAEADAARGEVPEVATRVLVALGNPLNAPALVDAGIRMAGGQRPAELLLVRLIPTPRAPEFRTGLLDEEMEVAASVDSMKRLAERAAEAGIAARPLSFLSEDVGQDLALLARDYKCDAILLGWHRPSLPHEVIRALVHRTFTQAPCPVAVFVDRDGRGIMPAPDRPVLVALVGGAHDEAAIQVGRRVAADLGASVRLLGYLDSRETKDPLVASQELAVHADALRQSSGLWVVPEFAENHALGTAIGETATAVVAVVGVGDDWTETEDFGQPATTLAANTECSLLVVRAAGQPQQSRQPTRKWRAARVPAAVPSAKRGTVAADG